MRAEGFIAFAGMLLANAANAGECPDETNAGQGFTLERPGVHSEFRPTGDMMVHVLHRYDDGPMQTEYFVGGLVEVFQSSKSSQSAVIPLSDLQGIFPLKSKARHRIELMRLLPDKKSAAAETLELRVSGKETFHLGDCEYDVLAVKQTVKRAGGRQSEVTTLYAPVLKAVLAKRYDEGTSSEQTVAYETVMPLAD